MFNKVDFPDPDSPIMAINSPCSTEKLMSFKATVETPFLAAYTFFTCCTSKIFIMYHSLYNKYSDPSLYLPLSQLTFLALILHFGKMRDIPDGQSPKYKFTLVPLPTSERIVMWCPSRSQIVLHKYKPIPVERSLNCPLIPLYPFVKTRGSSSG